MKKLMIAAATAAMVSGAFALNEAQVYDFTASIKTTGCVEGKVSKALQKYMDHNNFGWSVLRGQFEVGDKIGLRKQRSVKLAGVIWGCDCPTIARPAWRTFGNIGQYIGGYLFWNQTRNEVYDPRPDGLGGWMTTFRWQVLNRIDTLTKCEGTFSLFCKAFNQGIYLVGSGFGSVKGAGCDTYISSISGNLAGTRVAPNDEFGCVFCAANGCLVAPLCDTCWDFNTTAWSVAYGTWKIKYNSKMSKNLGRTPYLSRVYNFKKAGFAREYLNFVERVWEWGRRNGFWDEDLNATEVIEPYYYDDEDKWPAAIEEYVANHEGSEIDAGTLSDVFEELADSEDPIALSLLSLFPDNEDWQSVIGTDDIDDDFVEMVVNAS